MISLVLGWMSELLPGLRSTTASLQAASRHSSIARAPKGSVRRLTVKVTSSGFE
jgi:hypothetical protein